MRDTPLSAARGKRELAVAVVAVAAGGALALLAGSRAWDTVAVRRAAPLGALVEHVAGRTIAPAVGGLAVVALAGVIAMLATRGRARTVLGGVQAVVGALLAWQSATGFGAVSDVRARSLVAGARTGVVLEAGQGVDVSSSWVWPATALFGAFLVIAGGTLVAVRGSGWAAMSSRYDAPPGRSAPRSAPRSGPATPDDAAAAARARADLALWQSLERGEDPTAQAGR